VNFAALAWDGWASQVPARVKIARAAGKQVRLFEMGPGFVEPQWCTRGHIGYVVSGEYVTDLDGDTWIMHTGESFILPPGTRHRSRNAGSLSAVVFLVDLDPESAPAAPVSATQGQVEA
jgi:quercetin dioxygenase-like cupin family protein